MAADTAVTIRSYRLTIGSWRIVSLRFLCPDFRYHLTPLGINQSPTGCIRRVWFLLVGGPLARFEVRVSRHCVWLLLETVHLVR